MKSDAIREWTHCRKPGRRRILCAVAGLFALSLVHSASTASVMEVNAFDSAAIRAAVARAQPGDTVHLPEGTFELTEPIRPKSAVKLLGAGQERTRLVYKGTQPGVLINLAGCEDVELAQMTLDGQNNPLVHQGISGNDSRRLWLHHLTIRNLKAKTWGPHGILFSGRNPTMEGGVTDSRITDCRIESIGLDAEYGGGIRLAWGSGRNEVIGNVIHGTGRGGIFGDHSAELIVRNNCVTGSGGEGLGIELWGGCPRSLIEDNAIDHWLSVDQGHQTAVRRNVIGDDATVKFLGIEIIARDVVVTDNVVKRGAQIGLSVSNRPAKNNVYWGYNTVRDCAQWGAQLQGESGGIAHQYFYRCVFENAIRGHAKAIYPGDSGHGFRTNGACRGLVFEDCAFRNNGGYGVQLGGANVDCLDFLRSAITGNAQAAVVGPGKYTALEFNECKVERNKSDQLPAAKPFLGLAPVVDFRSPESIRAAQPAAFQCTSRASGDIADRLWDFGEGIPEVTAQPKHTFAQPGKYRVTLIVWDKNGRGGRAEKMVEVLRAK
ncbi:MAG: right-handed parallel beta-helix repeat-containing protein [Pirellulales bacterium]